jgi:hypothetical protein
MESWRRYLNEVEFHDSPDEDKPGRNQIIVFSADEDYDVEGSTHGALSHMIKHYNEFAPEKVAAGLQQALKIAAAFNNFTLKNAKSGAVIAQGDEAKKAANENAMLNTFDLINDKMQNKEPLTDEEKQLSPPIAALNQEYQQLVDSYMSDATDLEEIADAGQIKQLLDSGKIVKFIGFYKGKPVQYFLNTSNTGLVAYNDGKVATLFRIDKKGNDLAKVAKYFGDALKNKALGQALASYAGAPAEEPQQQQKKEKPQQQKKGPNIKAMAMGMQRGGKSFEEIQAQIEKSTGRKIPVENIKQMIGA